MDVEGLSETALAKRHRVTRAAFSKLVVAWSETFGLPPSRGMRSKRARHAYRQARLTSLAQHHDQAQT
jgi:transposase